VSVTGPIDQGSGWLVDLKKLGQIVKKNVVNILDHSQIEEDIEWFKGRQPSSENILIWAWGEIAPRLEQGIIHRLRLVETHSIYTDYYGPEQ
jgi:6-pyruvoyltetrahydropterin/6-carboxytetrahydropterin synthase